MPSTAAADSRSGRLNNSRFLRSSSLNAMVKELFTCIDIRQSYRQVKVHHFTAHAVYSVSHFSVIAELLVVTSRSPAVMNAYTT